jgi:hypothetical protein
MFSKNTVTEKIKYMLYCKNKDMNESEQFVMDFKTIEQAVDFINLCTLHDMIYKIYSVELYVKKLISVYKYLTIKNNQRLKYYSDYYVKKSWQSVNLDKI